MLVDAYDGKTARAWLFGTNTRLDEQCPIEVLAGATEMSEFAPVVRFPSRLDGRACVALFENRGHATVSADPVILTARRPTPSPP